jgi:hypothetical protein
MKATNLGTRIIFLLFAMVFGLFNSPAKPALSDPQGQGNLQWYLIPDSAIGDAPFGLAGEGHIDSYGILRCPAPGAGSCRFPVSDRILFTKDSFGALGIIVTAANVHDRWTWFYYFPGNPPGGTPDITCWMQIRLPGEPGNTTGFVALVSNCNSTGVPQAVKTFPDGCQCNFSAAGGPLIAGHPAASEVGTWTAIVDYTDPYGVTTPAVAQDNIYLMRTPGVIVIPGWREDCSDDNPDDGIDTLEQKMEQELAVTGDRVTCYEYYSAEGVAWPAAYLAPRVRALREELDMGPDEEVDLAGHSMGGLVARYYVETDFYNADFDGPIGSISMLGTPNKGAHLAAWHETICSISIPTPWGDIEWCPFEDESDAIRDMAPGSGILIDLNDGFTLPEPPDLPLYHAHAGGHQSFPGFVMSGDWDNDCAVSTDSVAGPGAAFGGDLLSSYEPLSHGGEADFEGCTPPTLTNDSSVFPNLAATIKGNPAGLDLTGRSLAEAEPAATTGQAPTLMIVADYVQLAQSKTHQLSIPDGLGDTAFVVYWLDSETENSQLDVTLRRPNGQPVDPANLDVLGEVAITNEGPYGMLMRGLMMSAPEAGDWEITVEGMSVPEQGEAYLIVLTPDSQIVLSAGTMDPGLDQGAPQIITATLVDGSTPIVTTSVSAQVSTPAGTEEPLVLRDDGYGGDQTAGDLVYSGRFEWTLDCGRYGVLIAATGNSSEGTVTRQQSTYFQSQAPGDAVGDPCNIDDDEDLLSDYDELHVVRTNPYNPDTDGDGMPDGYEAARTCLDPLVDDAAADPDNDGQNNLAEYGAGTNPCSAGGPVGGIAEYSFVGPETETGEWSLPSQASALLAAVCGAALIAVAAHWRVSRRRRAR